MNPLKEAGIYKMLREVFFGMTMDDFMIFMYVSTNPTAPWDAIASETGCCPDKMATALNKLCSSKSVTKPFQYGLLKKVEGLDGVTTFALTDKGRQYSTLFH